mmetsp:Transcript_27228/g.63440  ORF Transcript_27228/g.63440 Transcript_27228/m.63440 type:complete len:88 (+) Transcript_27228:175-438(+)
MAKLHLGKLKEMHQKDVEVYFFDDFQKYLDAVCKEVFKKQLELFPNEPVLKTHVVRYSWYPEWFWGLLRFMGFRQLGGGLKATQCTS